MNKIDIIIDCINIGFTVLNTLLTIIIEVKKNSFISETHTTLVRYRYFLYVLLEPYFKLLMAALFFDVLLYLVSFLLKRYFFKLNKENQQNILIKSVQDNQTSNIIVEFFFMVMIKGLALGFGFFYLIELIKEIDKIKGISDINKEQESVLNGMKTTIIIAAISNCMTIGYQFVYFGIRFFKSWKKKIVISKEKSE